MNEDRKEIRNAVIIFLNDFGTIALLLALYALLHITHSYIGMVESLLRATLLYSIVYGIPIYLCHALGVRLLKSNLIYFILTVTLASAYIIFSVMGAAKGHLTYEIKNLTILMHSVGDLTIYLNGKLTPAGLVYKMINPFSCAVIYASFKILKKKSEQ